MSSEAEPTLRSIDSFLQLSNKIGSEHALRLSMRETGRKQKESSWQYRTREALQITQESLGLGGFTPRRIKRILKMVEADVDRVISPVIGPVLDPLITVTLYEP